MRTAGKREGLIVHQADPLNAETPRTALADDPLTPLDAFYVRCHGPVPRLEPGSWRLRVEGLVERPLVLSLATLRERFEPRRLTATLECAGNRRAGLLEVRGIPGEAPWGPGAIGNAQWRGVRLGDVLADAGLREEAAHVELLGVDVSSEADPPQAFGASIPRDKALAPETLLVWEMNGAPLPAVHGAPLRALVPGYIGARSVKWLWAITARATPSENHFQAHAYRLLADDEDPGVALGAVAVNADILAPADGAQVRPGRLEVRGYAFAGDGRRIVRVDVSSDGGACWRQAELLDDLGPWAWRLWRAELELPGGTTQIVARAWDSAAATQPERPATLWNPKGYVNNSWARVTITAADPG